MTERIKEKVKKANEYVVSFQKGARKIMTLARIGGKSSQKNIFSNTVSPSKRKKSKMEDDGNEDVMFNDKTVFLNVVFDEILKCQTAIPMMARYMITRFFCRRFLYNSTQV